MKRDTTEQTFETPEEGLFDNWFDPIEEALRARVRGFLAALIEEELTTTWDGAAMAGGRRMR